MKKESIAVVLPAFNEALTVRQTLEDFSRELPEAFFVVVDNNSTDKTAEIAQRFLSETNFRGVVLSERRKGKAFAVRKAFSNVEAEIYVMADADFTYPAKHVRELIAPVASGLAEMVVGNRHHEDGYKKQNNRNFHSLGNSFIRNLVNFLFGSNLRDVLSGYRVFSRSFVETFPILSDGFQLEVEVTLHALDKRLMILELPVEYLPRPEESFSKLNTFGDGFQVLRRVFSILKQYKPFMFFGIISLILFVLGLATAIPVVTDYFTYKYVYHVPSAVLAVAFELMAAVIFAIGLILDAISEKNRHDFEIQIMQAKKRGN